MGLKFVDSTIATKFGDFNIRVYEAAQGKETVVLWKGNFGQLSVPLVRIHSECLTGDALGGLNCDCGKQLSHALKKIGKEGGVLIYLRQEGRGIGLFEKIKTYAYQKKGYDTFEANVILGHRPDERTYEMAKIVLDDLNVRKIKILTNNPIKISELAKLGIEIDERIPLISRSNRHNRRYFDAKKNKFNHGFSKRMHPYFYQFHAEFASQVIEIGKFLKGRKNDPYQSIFVGVVVREEMLDKQKEIERIALICKACVIEEFTPVLHFSFFGCKDIVSSLRKIKQVFPFATRLQMNDLSKTVNSSELEIAFTMFDVDFPLSHENFGLIKHKRILNLIKKYEAFVLLDNSRGRGIQEKKEVLMDQVEILLNLGLSNIALYGGFGPDELETFFALRNYYHLNFSIDAETKLKTNGSIDIQKTKKFLAQLLGINQTLYHDQSIAESSVIHAH